MKRTKNVLSGNIGQMFHSMYFWISILVVFILMLVGNVYVDMENGQAYSVFSIIFNKNAQSVIDEGNIVFENIVLGEFKGYIWMFAPILSTLPYVTLICSGTLGSNTRFKLGRAGKIPYVIGETLSGVIAGGIILLVGFWLYCLVTFTVLNYVYTGNNHADSYMYDMYVNSKAVGEFCKTTGLTGIMLLKSLSVFLYGCISAFAVLFFLAIIKNKYIVMTTPFVLNYLWNNSAARLLGRLFGRLKDGTALSGIYKSLVSQSGMGMLALNSKIEIFVIIALNFLILLLILGIKYLSIERRCDCGEA